MTEGHDVDGQLRGRPTAWRIAAYAAGKAAIEQLAKVAAMELGARAITGNAICPGVPDTDLLPHTNPEAALAQVARRHRRCSLPACQPRSRWLSGEILYASDGL